MRKFKMICKEKIYKYLKISVTVIFLFLIIGCNPRALPFIRDKLKANDEIKTKNADEAVKTDEKLKELDDLCKSIPLPNSFKFYSKNRSVKGSDSIFFFYQTQGDYDSYENFFKDYLSKDGWELIKVDSSYRSTEYRKNDKRVAIFFGSYLGEFADCSFTCERINKKKD
jgi:hypothetical protein